MRARAPFALPLCAALLAAGSPAAADGYRRPHGPLGLLADEPGEPRAEIAPDGRTLALLESRRAPSLASLGGRERRLLADVIADAEARAPRSAAAWDALRLVDVASGRARSVTGLPAGARLRDPAFAPDGRTLALTNAGAGALELWLVDVAPARARRVPRLRLNGVFPSPCAWAGDSRSLVCRAVPRPAPPLPAEDDGPRVSETHESAAGAPARTDDAFEARLFAAAARAQAVTVTLAGRVSPWGDAAMFRRALPSPDGRWLLVETLPGPAVASLPADRQARRIEVWDGEGSPRARVADLLLARVQPGSADESASGPRLVAWRPDAPAVLAWAEAEDEIGDRLMTLDVAPAAVPRPWARGLRGRVTELAWLDDGGAAVVTASDVEGRFRLYRVERDSSAGPRLLAERAAEPDPGRLAQRDGRAVGKSALHLLRGPAPDTPPGLERVGFDGAARELWRAGAEGLERPLALLDADGRRLLTRRESPDTPPSFALRDLERGTLTALTSAPPSSRPALRHEAWRAARDGAATAEADVWLPVAGDGRARGALVWLYPGGRAGNEQAWVEPSLRDPRLWALDGWTVVVPLLPFPGSGGASGEAYVQAVAAHVQALVDEGLRRGALARGRVALGGHSFGAGLTALLLERGDAFACGIAIDGAYNRTLTPLGFQGLARPLWRALQDYLALSALTRADRLRAPLLLIHGTDDPHPATPAAQSEQFFAALRGAGARARLVLLPRAGHEPRARESLLHALAEMQEWLERWLGAPARRPR